MARSMGMSTREEWDEYRCPGAYQLPKDPDVVWAASWRGWDDFLGAMLPFAEAKRMVSALRLTSELEYGELMRTGEAADVGVDTGRLPARPPALYAREWAGWDDFLSVGIE